MDAISSDILDRLRLIAGTAHEAARLYAEGAVLLAARDTAAAVDRFERALAEGDGRFRHKLAHGLCAALLEAGRATEAEPIARGLVEARPDLLTPYILLGLSLLQQRRFDDALAVHRLALERGGDDLDVVQVVADGAVALDHLGRFEEGERWCLDGLARLVAPDPTLSMNLAAFRLRLGKLEAAKEALRTARDIAPDIARDAESIWVTYGDGSPL